jgi:hypothetical protein
MPHISLHRFFRRWGRGAGLAVAGLALGIGLQLGCQTVVPDTIMGADGPVTLTQIKAVLNDSDLTDDAARRQALRDLGITDEAVIDLLIEEASSL